MGSSATDANGFIRSLLINRFGREALRSTLKRIGFDTTHWVRIVAYRETRAWLEELGIKELDTLEIAPGEYWRDLSF